jgi:hypothetical protein
VTVIVGTFATRTAAEAAAARVRAAGFPEDAISLIARANEPGSTPEPDPRRESDDLPVTAFATITGVLIGGALFGPVGAIVGGLAAGGSLGTWLSTRGLSEEEARQFESELAEGRFLLAIEAGDREREVRDLLAAGAEEVVVQAPPQPRGR